MPKKSKAPKPVQQFLIKRTNTVSGESWNTKHNATSFLAARSEAVQQFIENHPYGEVKAQALIDDKKMTFTKAD